MYYANTNYNKLIQNKTESRANINFSMKPLHFADSKIDSHIIPQLQQQEDSLHAYAMHI